MSARTLIAGVAGGVMLFVWGAVSHMALGLGSMGVKTIANEDPVLSAMRANIPEPGFYFLPGEGMEVGTTPTPEQQARWEAKYRQGPTGILVYQPQGREPLDPMQFLTELASNIGAALVAALLLSAATSLTGFGARVLAMASLGLFSWLDLSVSYWNWYGFPMDYSLGILLQGVVGWALVGAVMAAILKPRAA
ncbi:MAG: hypothetical protein L0212_08745 [Acidobacteria bacterium]|nr:hypothetical protein [Acidobacteriota bacterium]